MIALSVSQCSIDTGMSCENLIQWEAVHICENFNWCSFLCVLGLSSVIARNIKCYYPLNGSLKRYKIMFNQVIQPRCSSGTGEIFHLLFCYEGSERHQPFKHNHYVPLLFFSAEQNRKRKMLRDLLKSNSKNKQHSILSFVKQTKSSKIEAIQSLKTNVSSSSSSLDISENSTPAVSLISASENINSN